MKLSLFFVLVVWAFQQATSTDIYKESILEIGESLFKHLYGTNNPITILKNNVSHAEENQMNELNEEKFTFCKGKVQQNFDKLRNDIPLFFGPECPSIHNAVLSFFADNYSFGNGKTQNQKSENQIDYLKAHVKLCEFAGRNCFFQYNIQVSDVLRKFKENTSLCREKLESRAEQEIARIEEKTEQCIARILKWQSFPNIEYFS